MGIPGLGRTVLELAADPGSFYTDLDKAERRVLNLGHVFDKAGKNLQAVGTGAKSFGDTVNRSMATADAGTAKLSLSLKSLGTALAGFVSVRAVAAAVSSYTELTGKLTDLSAKTGISTTELQKLKYAAELSGGSLEGVTKAISIMARNLVEGDASAVAAMKRLGLNIHEIRQMQPGVAFTSIAEAIGKIPNPMEQSTLAMQLFGKSGAEILPMIKSGMTEAFQAAERLGIVMDEQTVKAGDRLGDTLTTLSAVGQGVIGKVLGPMTPAIQLVADAMTGLGDVVTWLQDRFTDLIQLQIKQIKFWLDSSIAVVEFASKMPLLNRTLREHDKAALESGKAWSRWLDDMAKGMDVTVPKAVTQTTNLRTAVGLLTKEQTKAGDASEKAMDQAAKAAVKLAKEAKAAGEALERMFRDALRSGAAGEFSRWGEKQRAILEDNTEATVDLLKADRERNEYLHAWYTGDGNQYINYLETTEEKTREWIESIFALGDALEDLARHSSGAFGEIVAELANLVNAMKRAHAAGGQIAQGGFSNIAQGSLAGAAAIGQATATGSRGSRVGKGAATGASIGANPALMAATGGWSVVIGAGIGALVGYIRSLNQGRKAVKEFAEAHGGFDALHARLMALGAGGEALWKSLTQGVGRSNPDQAKAVIAEVAAKMQALELAQAKFNTGLTAALQGIQQWGGAVDPALLPYIAKLREAGRLTQENIDLLDQLGNEGAISWQQVQATAEKYGIDISRLGDTFQKQRLHASWQELIDDADFLARAHVDVNAALDGMADEVNALVQESIKFKTEIPENMREWIQRLADSGRLLDEQGNKITDISQLTFGETLQTSLQKLNATIKDLIDTLDGVPKSMSKIPKSVDVDVNFRRNDGFVAPDYQLDQDLAPAASGGRVLGHGIRRFTDGGMVPPPVRWRLRGFGTDTVVGALTPGELILNRSQQGAVGALVAAAMGGAAVSGLSRGSGLPFGSRDGAAGGPVPAPSITAEFHINAIDGASVERTVKSRAFIEAVKSALSQDLHGLRHHVQITV